MTPLRKGWSRYDLSPSGRRGKGSELAALAECMERGRGLVIEEKLFGVDQGPDNVFVGHSLSACGVCCVAVILR